MHNPGYFYVPIIHMRTQLLYFDALHPKTDIKDHFEFHTNKHKNRVLGNQIIPLYGS